MATAARRSQDESFSALRQQVLGLEDDYRELKSVVVGLDRKMETGLAAINTKLDDKNKTPWGVIFSGMAFILAFCMAIGTLAYMPIKSDTDTLKADAIRRHDQVRLESRQNYDQLVTRDQRIWDALLKMQSQVDRQGK